MADISESSWPGEREPSRYDVASANELPDSEHLSAFKHALFSSPDSKGCENLMHMDLRAHNSVLDYTYPMAVLSTFPVLPTDEELSIMWQLFSLRSAKTLLYKLLCLPSTTHQSCPPYLRFAVASLAYVHCSDSPMSAIEAEKLFHAGARLWVVMSEVDNREARSLDNIKGAALLCNYGFMTADEATWKVTETMLCGALTMARRTRLLDRIPLENMSVAHHSVKSNSFSGISICLFMADIIHSLHTGYPLSMSNRELTINMSSTDHQFQDVYKTLLQPGTTFARNIGPDDATLLLLALLSEQICLRRSFAAFLTTGTSLEILDAEDVHQNPYVPLTATAEYIRMDHRINLALTRWSSHFASSAPSGTLALYHFCQLYRSCSHLDQLPYYAGYKPLNSRMAGTFAVDGSLGQFQLSDDTVRNAWLILDHITTKTVDTQGLSSIWLPVVLFYASLVIWAKVRQGELKKESYGSLKLLLVFKMELEKLQWPCCAEMAATLDGLMSR